MELIATYILKSCGFVTVIFTYSLSIFIAQRTSFIANRWFYYGLITAVLLLVVFTKVIW
jgi:hypothetical protein